MDTLADLRAGKLAGATTLNLRNTNLKTLPAELIALAPTLEHLDLSQNPFSSLPAPATFPYASFTRLKRAFFSDCSFTTFPSELSLIPNLSMVSFRTNGMESIPEGALPHKLRWLILTGNQIARLPNDIGQCTRLEKCMLAGNKLEELPSTMANCRRLALLRLSCNQLKSIPAWLLQLPNLAFLAFSGNPCTSSTLVQAAVDTSEHTPLVPFSTVTLSDKLGEGASGVIYRAHLAGSSSPVAVKMFKSSTITSDGSPADEMRAALLAGKHANLVSVLGKLEGGDREGLVLDLVPPSYTVLGLPPTFDSCSRDAFEQSKTLDERAATAVLLGIAEAACHAHTNGILHGDLYAHNILFSPSDQSGEPHALLGDFGAATVYGGAADPRAAALEGMESLAFGHLVEDVLGILNPAVPEKFRNTLKSLHTTCVDEDPTRRPRFASVVELLHSSGPQT
ncbi:kinase family protein [Meredithblackwellia eburnea MCA 4105]